MATPGFAVGDRVMIRRNLDHPAWMKQVETDPRNGGTTWVRRTDLDEEIGVGEITDSFGRAPDRVPPQGGPIKPAKRAVLASNGFWYDADSGFQVGSKTTIISPIQDD